MADLTQNQKPLIFEVYKVTVEHFLEDNHGNTIGLDIPFYTKQVIFKGEAKPYEPIDPDTLKEMLNGMCKEILQRAGVGIYRNPEDVYKEETDNE